MGRNFNIKNYALKDSTVERLYSIKQKGQTWDSLFNELIDATINCYKNHRGVKND